MTRPGAPRGLVPVGLALAVGWFWASRLLAQTQTETGLSLPDLAPYRAAIEGKPAGPAVAVTFRELWEHPEKYQGRHVRVEGRAARRVAQGKFGTFPPLVELWVTSPAGDPYCLVFPAKPGNETAIGAAVRFEGIFLKTLRYEGADAARLAPLIAGPLPPEGTAPAPPKPENAPPGGPIAWRDGVLGLIAVAFIGLALARQHLKSPARRPRRGETQEEAPPEFLEGP
jgi:hypothetical protein